MTLLQWRLRSHTEFLSGITCASTITRSNWLDYNVPILHYNIIDAALRKDWLLSFNTIRNGKKKILFSDVWCICGKHFELEHEYDKSETTIKKFRRLFRSCKIFFKISTYLSFQMLSVIFCIVHATTYANLKQAKIYKCNPLPELTRNQPIMLCYDSFFACIPQRETWPPKKPVLFDAS